MSKNTKQVNVIVWSRGVILSSFIWWKNKYVRKDARCIWTARRHQRHLFYKNPECSSDDDHSWEKYVPYQRPRDHWLFDVTRWLSDDVFIHGFHSQTGKTRRWWPAVTTLTILLPLFKRNEEARILTLHIPLSRRAIHDYIDPQDLHRIQRIRNVQDRGHRNEWKCSNTPGGKKNRLIHQIG